MYAVDGFLFGNDDNLFSSSLGKFRELKFDACYWVSFFLGDEYASDSLFMIYPAVYGGCRLEAERDLFARVMGLIV